MRSTTRSHRRELSDGERGEEADVGRRVTANWDTALP
jgi:hypothetical protein